mmetsp:Transcript_8853/g.14518  ORF Transcript_8853/g.14518 Transcript_8853/m.14518 type:complete len:443 (-) Transcript_8853:50-1378(-)|eukprot:CAMPEP_0184651492 /NCGR_PEP_ID=MMETSP0308-20130426/9109_1 /TAXON_ID=38269 /ORGANISM="Gloeochaete witrockiana, Strain SAG 46.84" /LENGTH=442 /DNA_ID=CAMNT_0027085757 /DNA_START=108 /DNA_END=1436 /DNA_ORIENTATION=+
MTPSGAEEEPLLEIRAVSGHSEPNRTARERWRHIREKVHADATNDPWSKIMYQIKQNRSLLRPFEHIPRGSRRRVKDLHIDVYNQQSDGSQIQTPTGSRRRTVLSVRGNRADISGDEIKEVISSLGLELVEDRSTLSVVQVNQENIPAELTGNIDKLQRPDSPSQRYFLRRVDSSVLGYLKQKVTALLWSPEDESQPSPDSEELRGIMEDLIMCHICLEPIHTPATLLPCQHDFDAKCLTYWLARNDKCPLCRREVRSVRPNAVLQKVVDAHNNKQPTPNPHPTMNWQQDIPSSAAAPTSASNFAQNGSNPAQESTTSSHVIVIRMDANAPGGLPGAAQAALEAYRAAQQQSFLDSLRAQVVRAQRYVSQGARSDGQNLLRQSSAVLTQQVHEAVEASWPVRFRRTMFVLILVGLFAFWVIILSRPSNQPMTQQQPVATPDY